MEIIYLIVRKKPAELTKLHIRRVQRTYRIHVAANPLSHIHLNRTTYRRQRRALSGFILYALPLL